MRRYEETNRHRAALFASHSFVDKRAVNELLYRQTNTRQTYNHIALSRTQTRS